MNNMSINEIKRMHPETISDYVSSGKYHLNDISKRIDDLGMEKIQGALAGKYLRYGYDKTTGKYSEGTSLFQRVTCFLSRNSRFGAINKAETIILKSKIEAKKNELAKLTAIPRGKLIFAIQIKDIQREIRELKR